jgi:hypothetical protein
VAGAWSWPLTSMYCQGKNEELYLCSPVHLHGVHRRNFTFSFICLTGNRTPAFNASKKQVPESVQSASHWSNLNVAVKWLTFLLRNRKRSGSNSKACYPGWRLFCGFPRSIHTKYRDYTSYYATIASFHTLSKTLRSIAAPFDAIGSEPLTGSLNTP